MKSLRALALAVLVAFTFSGCFQEEKVIKLNPDGSGTVVETMVMSKEVVQQLQGFASGFGGLTGGKSKGDGAASPFQILDENKLRDAADKMGDGVTFVSATPVTTAMGEGFVATYAFEDINKLKVDQNPGDNVPGGNNPMMKMNKMKKEPVKFEFTKGSPASLTVKMPQPKQADLEKSRPKMPNAAGGDMAAMMMQQMFKNLKISVAVEVGGKITESNAEYQDGSRVTLVDIDFNKVLADPEKFKALTQAQPKTLEEAKTLVKGIDGIKAETQPTVTVKFQ
jgi:hypothetical protein